MREKNGLRQIREFSKSFLANKWWRRDDSSARRPGSKVGDGRGEGQLGGARSDLLDRFWSSTVGPAIDNRQEGEGPQDLLLI